MVNLSGGGKSLFRPEHPTPPKRKSTDYPYYDEAGYNQAFAKGKVQEQSYGEYLLQRMIVVHNLQP